MKRAAPVGRPFSVKTGGDLLSQGREAQVPSALRGLTSLFGMGRGVSPSLSPPKGCETRPSPALENRTAGRPRARRSAPAERSQKIRQALEPLVPVCSAHRCDYTSGLSPGGLPGVLLPQGDGRAHLEVGFPLRCLQRLSDPHVANQRCPWRDNWYTRGAFVPVLSY